MFFFVHCCYHKATQLISFFLHISLLQFNFCKINKESWKKSTQFLVLFFFPISIKMFGTFPMSQAMDLLRRIIVIIYRSIGEFWYVRVKYVIFISELLLFFFFWKEKSTLDMIVWFLKCEFKLEIQCIMVLLPQMYWTYLFDWNDKHISFS